TLAPQARRTERRGRRRGRRRADWSPVRARVGRTGWRFSSSGRRSRPPSTSRWGRGAQRNALSRSPSPSPPAARPRRHRLRLGLGRLSLDGASAEVTAPIRAYKRGEGESPLPDTLASVALSLASRSGVDRRRDRGGGL